MTPLTPPGPAPALQEAPYVMIRKKQHEDGRPLVGNDLYEGFCAEVALKIATLVKFDYVLRIVKDGKFGVKDGLTGEWNGMVGELTRWVDLLRRIFAFSKGLHKILFLIYEYYIQLPVSMAILVAVTNCSQ